MEESRTQRLQQLLKRLGQAVHGSVVQSKEVQECLDELHDDGWRAVMLLEASLVCRDNGILDSENGSIHIHVDPSEATANYRMDVHDAKLLSSLGISPSRHRARRTPRRSGGDDQSDRQDG
jgi:hypothetical protein